MIQKASDNLSKKSAYMYRKVIHHYYITLPNDFWTSTFEKCRNKSSPTSSTFQHVVYFQG